LPERLFEEVMRGTDVVTEVSPNETRPASTLATEIVPRNSEKWARERYPTMTPQRK
jgi:hypothetical protein